MPEVVPATAQIMRGAYDQLPPVSIKAWALVDGDKVLGVAGWYVTARGPLVFSDIFQDLPKLLIYKLAKQFMGAVPDRALCYSTPNSWRFLERLGWEHTGIGDENGVYFKWRNSLPSSLQP